MNKTTLLGIVLLSIGFFAFEEVNMYFISFGVLFGSLDGWSLEESFKSKKEWTYEDFKDLNR